MPSGPPRSSPSPLGFWRLGLVGLPGAGKTTLGNLIHRRCVTQGIAFSCLKLAEPLYEAQAMIYRLAGITLSSKYQQDGELLNFLGQHLRKLNPCVLTDNFGIRLRAMEKQLSALHTPSMILCDDIRQTEAEFLRELGFFLIGVNAPPDECSARRRRRGDLTLGAHDHSTEANLDKIRCDRRIDNSGTLDAFTAKAEQLLDEIIQ